MKRIFCFIVGHDLDYIDFRCNRCEKTFPELAKAIKALQGVIDSERKLGDIRRANNSHNDYD